MILRVRIYVFLIILSLMTITLSSCGFGNTPEAVARKALKAWYRGDIEVLDSINPPDSQVGSGCDDQDHSWPCSVLGSNLSIDIQDVITREGSFLGLQYVEVTLIYTVKRDENEYHDSALIFLEKANGRWYRVTKYPLWFGTAYFHRG